MIARLVADIPPPVWITVVPAVLLVLATVVFQPQSVFRPRHHHGVRATRILRQLAVERARQRPRPTGYASPAWTVQPREVVAP